MYKNPKMVHVKWYDAMSIPRQWIDRAELELTTHEEMLVDSVGYLVKETKDYTMIAMSLGGEQYGNVLTIPNGMIKEVIKLGTEKGKASGQRSK
jgi:hypothetical protein